VRLVLVRHAEPLVLAGTPAAEWPLTERGQDDARRLGASLAQGSTNPIVWASPERRACDTTLLAFPGVQFAVRDQLSEVKKPWYGSATAYAKAATDYLRGEAIDGWERRQAVADRLATLKSGFGSAERLILVSHAVLLTVWLDDEIGLDDPASFWAGLRMPDAWELDADDRSLERIPW
jgi:broad specificity phosphatase PhoE